MLWGMNINASIIDQRVRKLADEYEEFIVGDEDKKRSAAFVLLCLQTMLDINVDDALDSLMDGGGDAAIDGLHIGDELDGEFVVTVVQGKYKRRLDGEAAFPATEIGKIAATVGALFDPDKRLRTHGGLEAAVEDIRSRVRDGSIPRVRVLLCNNGGRWKEEGDQHIRNAGLGNQVTWEHVNHDLLVELLQRQTSVDEQLQLSGKLIVESFNFRRVLIGKMDVTAIATLFDRHGDRLLERNIRRYLGLKSNRVNEGIRHSLIDPEQQPNFYFFNNGITMICSKFSHNALQSENHSVRVKDLQVINGGQTCKTIQRTVSDNPEQDMSKGSVLVRLYEIDPEQDGLVQAITYATNSQNPVDLRDLRSNDAIQQKLEVALNELGYTYKRKRDSLAADSKTITSSVAAEAVYAVWRWKPHVAKFRRVELFGKHYQEIFSEGLNAAQVVTAVLLFRHAENERKRPQDDNPPRFLPYASHVLAATMGRVLLSQANLHSIDELDHRNFQTVKDHFERDRDGIYQQALHELRSALTNLGLHDGHSLQRLSAQFRRGDLVEALLQAQ